MNARQDALMQEFLSQINAQYREPFMELAEFAAGLGYSPVRNKTKDISIDFRNNKLQKTIMKMDVREGRHDGYAYAERDVPGLRLKFYASDDYSKIFRDAVKRVIEDYGGKYTGCYGCGRCGGKPQGYTYVYPDGRKVFRCGSEQVSVYDFENNIDEVKSLLKRQADYFAERAAK